MTSKYMALPKGMSESSFDAAIAQFKKALGEDNVMIKDELVRPYTKVMMAVPTEEHTPSAVVTATTVEQVQEVVKICAQGARVDHLHRPQLRLRLGRTGPARPGGAGSAQDEQDHPVDPELCTALVEPGVTTRCSTTTSKRTRFP